MMTTAELLGQTLTSFLAENAGKRVDDFPDYVLRALYPGHTLEHIYRSRLKGIKGNERAEREIVQAPTQGSDVASLVEDWDKILLWLRNEKEGKKHGQNSRLPRFRKR